MDCMDDSPVMIACFPNSSCTATFARQLITMIHKAAKPALAPSTVVAINSPDPTIEAERINPGPRNESLTIPFTWINALMTAIEFFTGDILATEINCAFPRSFRIMFLTYYYCVQ